MAGLGEAADRTSSRASRKRHRAGSRGPRARRASPRTRAARRPRGRPARSRPGEPARVVGDELGEVGQELARQVVDDRVAEVLEQLRRGRLAAAREAADDDDVRVRSPAVAADRGRRAGRRAVASTSIARRGRLRAVRRDERRCPRTGRTSCSPRTVGLTRSPPGVSDRRKDGDPRIDEPPGRASRSEVRMPTRDSPNRRIGNSMTRPNTRNIVGHEVEVVPARDAAGCRCVRKLEQEAAANGSTT